jgi:hypothetical protein
MQNNGDQDAGKFMSSLVLIASVMFVSSVYMAYSEEKDFALYGEIESSYNNSANVFLGFREKSNNNSEGIQNETLVDLDQIVEEKVELE